MIQPSGRFGLFPSSTAFDRKKTLIGNSEPLEWQNNLIQIWQNSLVEQLKRLSKMLSLSFFYLSIIEPHFRASLPVQLWSESFARALKLEPEHTSTPTSPSAVQLLFRWCWARKEKKTSKGEEKKMLRVVLIFCLGLLASASTNLFIFSKMNKKPRY